MTSTFDPQKHHRHSIRLRHYDYSQAGAYFVTIVTYQRDCLFGKIVNEEMQLNEFGRIADECWRAIPEHFQDVALGAYVVMPNHVHGIIVINVNENRATTNRSSPLQRPNIKPGSLGAIVRSFKSAVTRRIGCESNTKAVWQRNYYEHVIRNDRDLQNKTDYIEANPMLWGEDDENPVRFV